MKPITQKKLDAKIKHLNEVYCAAQHQANEALKQLEEVLEAIPFEVHSLLPFRRGLLLLRNPPIHQVKNPFTPARLRLLQRVVELKKFRPSTHAEKMMCIKLVRVGALRERCISHHYTGELLPTPFGRALVKGMRK